MKCFVDGSCKWLCSAHRVIIFVICHLSFAICSHAQEKTVTNAQMIGAGGANILDTYLSPEKYKGTELRYISHTTREWAGSAVSHDITHQGSLVYGNNRADNCNEIGGAYHFSYGVHYNWQLCDGKLRLKAGGTAGVRAGFLYNMRNNNNPAQAQLAVELSPSAALTYRLKAWSHPLLLSYEASAPIAGLMFSPNYGQSYYEIFSRGNYDNNIVPTTPANAPSLRQMLAADFYFKSTALRLGYLCDIRQHEANGLKFHQYSNMLVIGFVKRFKITKAAP